MRLPDRPREEDLRHLPGTVLVALLRANGICPPEGCTLADAWTAIADWLATHPEQQLALPLGRLRLAPSPQRGRRSTRHRRAPSYDGMIESEGASAVTLSPSDGPSARDHASPTAGVPRGPNAAPRRTLGCRQSELLRKLPPAPSAAHLQGLSIDALRELLRANDVVMKPRTRKAKLRNAVLNLVAEPGSTVRLPDGLCRASDGVPVAPAFSPNAEDPGDDAPMRTLDDAQGRSSHVRRPARTDPSTDDPSGAQHRPSRCHGAPGAASGHAAELPSMPHQAPAYPADPDSGKLSEAVIAALERLPLRPSAADLRGTKFAGLQALLKRNGVPRPSNATVESMTRQLWAWLGEDNARVIELPRGVKRRGLRPLRFPGAPHRAGRSAENGRQTRDMSPHPRDGQPATASARMDDELLPLLGAPAHHAHASRRSQASGSASPALLRRPYNGSGGERGNGAPPKTRGDSTRTGDPSADDARIARAAAAFNDSAATTLAILDRLAPLIDRACRGESIPAGDLASLGPAVHTAQSVLRGVVAGCTAERLQPALTRASGGASPTGTGDPASQGGPRTYAQVASAPPQAPRRPPPAPLAPGRTALLSPAAEEHRHAPTRASAFGGALDAVLRRELGLGARPAVEEVRRTGRGDYAVQFSTAAWTGLADTRSWRIDGFGTWERTSSGPFRHRGSLVLTGIPTSFSDAALRQELESGAALRWPALSEQELQDIMVVRLNRRGNGPNRASSSQNDGSDWVPSTSVRLLASKKLCDEILNAGGTVLGFSFHKARPYQPALRKCMRCGQTGTHSAKYCRNVPRCRHCGLSHETSGCPSRPQRGTRTPRQGAGIGRNADCSPRSRVAQTQ